MLIIIRSNTFTHYFCAYNVSTTVFYLTILLDIVFPLFYYYLKDNIFICIYMLYAQHSFYYNKSGNEFVPFVCVIFIMLFIITL